MVRVSLDCRVSPTVALSFGRCPLSVGCLGAESLCEVQLLLPYCVEAQRLCELLLFSCLFVSCLTVLRHSGFLVGSVVCLFSLLPHCVKAQRLCLLGFFFLLFFRLIVLRHSGIFCLVSSLAILSPHCVKTQRLCLFGLFSCHSLPHCVKAQRL